MSWTRPSRCSCGTVWWYRMNLLPLIILKMPGGMSRSGCRWECPPSSSSTRAPPSLASFAATTQPAAPPPTTMWSKRSIMRSCPDRVQALPVERDPVARPVGGEGEAFLQDERLGDVALQAEAVRLEVGAVRAGGQELDRGVVGAVRGDRQVERLGE